ncbi:hypothetical protein [Aliamphritea spongicola]|uniref:hypothetical protein n=1 Tax=Aliamphritea spongicola TaxID=707589 RepID=UPI00196B4EE2|nr:hypothetical protein [Aliamphritea spongicola]MBN3564891.1 hypothetical protein [Aliamphritea spongicola]
MTVLAINAWLNTEHPSISLTNSITGQLIACWQDQAVQQLFDDGIITLTELHSSDRSTLSRLSHDLLLMACASSLCQRQSDGCFNCITGRLLQSYMQHNRTSVKQTAHYQPLTLTG